MTSLAPAPDPAPPSPTWTGIDSYRIVSCCLGLVLLVSAALKWKQLADGSFDDGLFSSPWFGLALVQLELGLGLALCAGLYPRVFRVLAVACFSCYLVVALHGALTGAPSCGCFGKVRVAPWVMVGFDLVSLAALLLLAPRPEPLGERPFSVRALLVLGLFLAAGAGAALTVPLREPVLVPSPFEVHLEPEGNGRFAEATVWLENTSPAEIEIASVQTSCHCVHVALEA
jgi:hypothetical protein